MANLAGGSQQTENLPRRAGAHRRRRTPGLVTEGYIGLRTPPGYIGQSGAARSTPLGALPARRREAGTRGAAAEMWSLLMVGGGPRLLVGGHRTVVGSRCDPDCPHLAGGAGADSQSRSVYQRNRIHGESAKPAALGVLAEEACLVCCRPFRGPVRVGCARARDLELLGDLPKRSPLTLSSASARPGGPLGVPHPRADPSAWETSCSPVHAAWPFHGDAEAPACVIPSVYCALPHCAPPWSDIHVERHRADGTFSDSPQLLRAEGPPRVSTGPASRLDDEPP